MLSEIPALLVQIRTFDRQTNFCIPSCGNRSPDQVTASFLMFSENLHRYMAKKFRQKRDLIYLAGRIISSHEQYVEVSQQEARDMYLDIVRKFETFGCSFMVAMVCFFISVLFALCVWVVPGATRWGGCGHVVYDVKEFTRCWF